MQMLRCRIHIKLYSVFRKRNGFNRVFVSPARLGIILIGIEFLNVLVISLLSQSHQHKSYHLSFPSLQVLRSMPSALLPSARVQQRILSRDRGHIFSSLYATRGLHIRSHSVFIAGRRIAKWWFLAGMLYMLHRLYWYLCSFHRCYRGGYWFTSGERWCSRGCFGVGWVVGPRWDGWCRGKIDVGTLSLSS